MMVSAIFIWWLVVQVFGLVALPFTSFLLQALPDRGYAFSKSLGLLLTAYGVWLLAMFGLGSFSLPLVLLVLLVQAGLGLVLLHRYWQMPLQPAAAFGWLRAVVQRRWQGMLAYELLFVLALIGLAWMRSHSLGFVGPHPWGTERPMDLAFFNAIRYSSSFPPPDPWLAGYSINYYYFGYLMMALVALLSGLEPGIAYNLALALVFALTALGVAGVITNLVLLTRQSPRPAAPPPAEHTSPPAPGLLSRLRANLGSSLAALLGVVLVVLVGNQAGALQVLVGDPRVVALDGPQLVAAVSQSFSSDQRDPDAEASQNPDQIELPYPAHTTDFGTFAALEPRDRLADFDWWWPSRALWDAPVPAPGPEPIPAARRYNITEFPFFSFWLGDMHPHVMALPFNLLAAALALATLSRATLPRFAQGRAGWLELLLTGLVLGSLYTINSWDLPTYILLYLGALLLLATRLAGGLPHVAWGSLGKQAGLVLLALFGLFLPFYLTFHSLVGFAQPLIDLPILGRLSTIIAPFTETRSGLHAFLIIFGLFLLPLLVFLYMLFLQPRPARVPPASAAPEAPESEEEASPATVPSVSRTPPPWLHGLALLPLVLLALGVGMSFPLLALAGVGIFAAVVAVRRVATPATSFALLVLALGCAICFGTELIYIRDVFGNRMNTIFKFYYQVWLLWGTMAAFALWWLLTQVRLVWQRGIALATALLMLPLLAGGLLYPAINLRDAVQKGEFVGLHGLTPRERDEAGAAATAWIRENVPPGSVVLEMVAPDGGSYNGEGYAAISAATGRPTVLGWVGHQRQWRGGDSAAMDELGPRQADVDLIYGSPAVEEKRALLRKYSVDYVYVGNLERAAYPPESLAAFEQFARPVFQQDAITIYAIPQADNV